MKGSWKCFSISFSKNRMGTVTLINSSLDMPFNFLLIKQEHLNSNYLSQTSIFLGYIFAFHMYAFIFTNIFWPAFSFSFLWNILKPRFYVVAFLPSYLLMTSIFLSAAASKYPSGWEYSITNKIFKVKSISEIRKFEKSLKLIEICDIYF